MSDYAQQVWKDSAGKTHNTAGEAVEASRRHMIAEGMHSTFKRTDTLRASDQMNERRYEAIQWFLKDPEEIICKWRAICDEVDGLIQQVPS